MAGMVVSGELCIAAFVLSLNMLLAPRLLSAPDQDADSSVRVICEAGHEKRFMERQEAVARLGDDLDQLSIDALYRFMNSKADSDLSGEELLALKDAVCAKLENQKDYPVDLPEKLIEMYSDRLHAEAWRDYCIQHLGAGFKRAAIGLRKDIAKTLWQAVEEHNGSIAGTALIALKDNSGDESICPKMVAAKAVEIVESKAYASASKATAIQICVQIGEKRSLPAARDFARSSKDKVLRLSSIAALGVLGGMEERKVLHECASSTDRLVSKAAQKALMKDSGLEHDLF